MINNEVIHEIINKNDYYPKERYTSQNFRDEYGLSVLEKEKKNKKLLEFLFGIKKQNSKSLTYRLENDKSITNYFGEASPGWSSGRILNYSNGNWRKNKKPISEPDAIELAYKIRTGIVNTLKSISEDSNAVDIKKMLEEYEVPSNQSWIKKYFTILYPNKFMPMLNEDWINRIFSPIGLTPSEDWYENSKTFCNRASEYGLDGVKFYYAIAKAVTNEVKKDLSERGVDTTIIKNDLNLTVNSLEGWEKAKEYIPDSIRADVEAYFDKKYSWTKDSEHNNASKDTSEQPVLGSTYLKEIIAVLLDLGGTASLEELYRKIEERDNIPSIHKNVKWHSSIRSAIYAHSSDSEYYQKGDPDLFESVGGIGSGQWKLREGNISHDLSSEDSIPEDALEKKEFDKSNWKKWTEEKRNLIVFGAPGTGKSYKLNRMKEKLIGKNNVDQYERVTFHPEYSYASFVGVYKPTPFKDENNKDSITYKFVPGPFIRMYVKAKQNPEKPYIIVIEEINRSNTAAVFGDLFQLLDRNSDFESEYPIAASKDIQDYLYGQEKAYSFDDNDHSIIRIPGNLFIWATMNSADQGVFPMDSAFKRRWNFEYVDVDEGYNSPIADGSPYTVENSKFSITTNGKKESIYWNDLRCAINNRLVTDLKVNEDKLLGAFFIKVDESDGSVSLEDIKYKVLMYLFDDVARQRRDSIFGKSTTRFSDIINQFDEKGLKVFNDVIYDEYRNKHPEPNGED